MSSLIGEFPLSKKETGVQKFSVKHPSYDGRNVTIAIFDSGVDPGAPGLQVTSEGKPKVVARYDCTGAGDVDTSNIAIAIDNKIIGLSGRTLVIPKSWTNPSGEYHIGLKNAYELYPKQVQNRMKKEKEEKHWNPYHNSLLSKTFSEKHNFIMENDYSKGTLSRNQIMKNDDLDSTIEALTTLEKKYKHITPVYDCIVFHNGKQWLALLDTSEIGDLASCKVMGEFSEDPINNFGYITALDHVSYSFNIYSDGNVLEIVSLCSSHGTNVSAIAAGCFPDEQEKNGVAPGAQIISLTIDDSRLETKETESAITRAMTKVIELQKKFQIDVINMSYDALSKLSHAGRISDVMNDVVDKHAITWVAGVGNEGPALYTIGTLPKNVENTIIGVGEYSLLKKVLGTTYTWSSRGPTIDGDRGVNICAPGAAKASAPRYLLRGSELNNGKSMSASYVAGATALLISGLKANEIDKCPYLIKKGMENTALYQDSIDNFSQGHGLLQVDKAFDYLIQYSTEMESYVKFIISCGTERNKGIHIRNAIENKISFHYVTVEPVFLNNVNIAIEKNSDFQMSLYIMSDVPWVIIEPKYLELRYKAFTFDVKIDPSGLEPGLHTSTIKAFDTKNIAKGPVFTIIVTIIRPLVANDSGSLSVDNIEFNFNSLIKRYFVLVPEKVSWASILVKQIDINVVSGSFNLQTNQLFPQKSFRFCNMFNLESNELQVHFPVEENIVLEFVLAKNWSSSSIIKLSAKVQFNGVIPQTKSLSMYHGMGLQSVILSPGIKNEEILPNAVLKNIITFFTPTETKIVALTDRDVIPFQRKMYQLNLSYTFFLHKTVDASTSYITCELFDMLYECEYESTFWMLFDSNNQYISAGNMFNRNLVHKLNKGIYTIKMHVRHERKDLLEKILELPIQIVSTLPNPITLDVYNSHYEATIFGQKSSIFNLYPRSNLVTLNIGPISDQKIWFLSAGTCLSGTISYVNDVNGKKVDYYDLKYFITDPCISKNLSKSVEDNETNKIKDFILVTSDVTANQLAKLEYGPDSNNLFEELCESGDNSSFYITWIQSIKSDDKKKFPNVFIKDFDREKTELIIAAADRVLSIINQNDLLAFYGIISHQGPNVHKIRIANDRLKNNLIAALSCKGAALCQLIFQDNLLQKKELQNHDETLKLIDELWLQVTCFVDPDSDLNFNFNYFNIWHGVVFKCYGRVMKTLLKMLDDKNIKEVENCLLWTVKTKFGSDKSKHLVNAISNALIVHYPKTFRPF